MMQQGAFSSLVAVLIMSTTIGGHASDSRTLDILGLRPGMVEPQVDALLLRQGVLANRITRTGKACPPHSGCDVTITTPTRDGELTISLVSDEREASLMVAQINYTLSGRGMGEHEMIRSSVLQRFGLPDQANPMTWCNNVTASGSCLPDHPSLSFLPESLTLILKAGSRDGVAK